MPELKRVEEIFRQVYKDYRLQQVFGGCAHGDDLLGLMLILMI